MSEPSTPIPWLSDPGSNHDDHALFTWWRSHLGFNCLSVPHKNIDLYADLISRHHSAEYPALTFQMGTEFLTLTYQDLDIQVCALHTQWALSSLEAGKSIAITTRNPLSKIIALLAALRAGLVPTVLTPKGSGRTIQEIKWLEPDFIHGDRDLIYLLPEEYQSRALPQINQGSASLPSINRQAVESTALRILNPYLPGPEGIQSITLGALFRNLLRDSSLVLGLNRSSRLATFRGHGPISPYVELCALFAGCHYIRLDPDGGSITRDFALEQSLDVIHLPLEIASQWLKHAPATAPKWARWMKDPLESMDVGSWASLVTSLKIQELPCASIHWSLQTGTAILGSSWNSTPYDLDLSPAEGVPWHLGDLKSPKTEAKQGFGLYCEMTGEGKDSKPLPSPLMLARNGTSYRLLGTHPKARSGVPFPERIAKKVLSLEGTWHAIVEQESPTDKEGVQFILLAFMDPRSPTEIQMVLEREVGDDGVPHEIRIFSLIPRFDETGNLDEPWIKRHYLSGELERRAKDPVYQALSTFKQAIVNSDRPNESSSS